MLDLAIDPTSPAAEQVRSQLVDRISNGKLAAETHLPTVRGLAEQLGIAPGTVAKAYRQLETDGFIETRGRNGTFVSAQGDAASQAVQRAAREFVDRARSLGVADAAALDWVRRAFD